MQDIDSGRVMITSQNHGFAVDEATLPANVKATHRSLFDGSLQGLALHRSRRRSASRVIRKPARARTICSRFRALLALDGAPSETTARAAEAKPAAKAPSAHAEA